MDFKNFWSCRFVPKKRIFGNRWYSVVVGAKSTGEYTEKGALDLIWVRCRYNMKEPDLVREYSCKLLKPFPNGWQLLLPGAGKRCYKSISHCNYAAPFPELAEEGYGDTADATSGPVAFGKLVNRQFEPCSKKEALIQGQICNPDTCSYCVVIARYAFVEAY